MKSPHDQLRPASERPAVVCNVQHLLKALIYEQRLLARLIYKANNQHRGTKYFGDMERVHRLLKKIFNSAQGSSTKTEIVVDIDLFEQLSDASRIACTRMTAYTLSFGFFMPIGFLVLCIMSRINQLSHQLMASAESSVTYQDDLDGIDIGEAVEDLADIDQGSHLRAQAVETVVIPADEADIIDNPDPVADKPDTQSMPISQALANDAPCFWSQSATITT